jgi:hypothetical protein
MSRILNKFNLNNDTSDDTYRLKSATYPKPKRIRQSYELLNKVKKALDYINPDEKIQSKI